MSGNDAAAAATAAVCEARHFIANLYDQKWIFKIYHQDLNIVAKTHDTSLLKLPQCEASFIEHVKRAVWQARAWEQHAHMGYPDLGLPLDFWWKQDSGILVPVYFEGQSASQLIKSLKCDCSQRQMY